jgi:hypothetical protein
MKTPIILFALLATLPSRADEIIGNMSKTPDGNFIVKDALTSKSYNLKMKDTYSKYLTSFLGQKTFLKFSGSYSGKDFIGDQTPVIVSAPSKKEGLFVIRNNGLYIDDMKIELAAAKKVNGTSFDQESIKFFNKKKVIANGFQKNSSTFYVTAIIPSELYSPADKVISQDPVTYITEKLPQNTYSQKLRSFKGTVFGGSSQQVKPSDYALVVTLSGRQGDDLGAANGHFAIGIAKVQKDLSLDMEIHNYYPPGNEKEIIPGYVDYVDYFGNLTAGQNNYRPTYTLIFYGESINKLKKMRDSNDEEFSILRSGKNNFSVAHNCTTVSDDGLARIGIVGKNKDYVRKNFSPSKLKTINPNNMGDILEETKTYLSQTVGKTPSHYFPRPSFDSLLYNLDRLLAEKMIRTYKVDFIFQEQTRSERKAGGAAADEFSESLKLSIKGALDKKMKYSSQEIFETLNEID